jgi:polysaccharide biosynthesis protein PslH
MLRLPLRSRVSLVDRPLEVNDELRTADFDRRFGNARGVMRILFIQKRLLFPTDTGAKVRTLNVVRHLARWHDLTFLCNARHDEATGYESMRGLGLRLEAAPWREVRRGSPRFVAGLARNVLSPHPFTIHRNYDAALHRRARDLTKTGAYDLVVCDTVTMAWHCLDLPVPARVLFQHNVDAEIFERHAQVGPSTRRRLYMKLQSTKMRRFEADMGPRFDAVVAVSERDREIFEEKYGWGHVHAIDTAVDLDYYQPVDRPEVADRVIFVGSMDWLPNQDGVTRFVHEAWPTIRRARPEATFQIIGRNPPAAVRRLAEVKGVEVVGTVPDTRPYVADAAVSVVPLWVGSGTRLKIYESMAMSKAVVSTALGAEGLPLIHGKEIWIADDPAALAESVITLLSSPGRRHALGAAGQRLVAARFGSEPVARQFEAICHQAVDRSSARRQRGVTISG